jgi:hypothetical protein
MEPGRNPVAAAFLGHRKHKAVAKKNKAYFSLSSAPMELHTHSTFAAMAAIQRAAAGFCQVIEAETRIRQAEASLQSCPPFRPPAPCP